MSSTPAGTTTSCAAGRTTTSSTARRATTRFVASRRWTSSTAAAAPATSATAERTRTALRRTTRWRRATAARRCRTCPDTAGVRRSAGLPLPAVPVEEPADLGPEVLVLGRAVEAGVRHGLEDVQVGVDPGGTQLSVHPHGVGQEQVAGARLEERRREAGQVGEQRGQVRVGQIVATRVEQVDLAQAAQRVVDPVEGLEGVPGL